MSRHAEVILDWADGTHVFRLGLAEIEELEDKFDRSIFDVAMRLGERHARILEISEVLRIGLIGGGRMEPIDALALVRRYVDERPIEENRDAAYAVVLAGLARVHGDVVKEPSGKPTAAESSSASTSPPSTEAQH